MIETIAVIWSLIFLHVFVTFGTFLAVGILHPGTEGQAVAAGLGWTSLASR